MVKVNKYLISFFSSEKSECKFKFLRGIAAVPLFPGMDCENHMTWRKRMDKTSSRNLRWSFASQTEPACARIRNGAFCQLVPTFFSRLSQLKVNLIGKRKWRRSKNLRGRPRKLSGEGAVVFFPESIMCFVVILKGDDWVKDFDETDLEVFDLLPGVAKWSKTRQIYELTTLHLQWWWWWWWCTKNCPMMMIIVLCWWSWWY